VAAAAINVPQASTPTASAGAVVVNGMRLLGSTSACWAKEDWPKK